MSRTISYRGLIADGGQDTINLHTNDGKTGYRITKLQGITDLPGTADREHVLKIYKVKQTAVDAAIDFSDLTLIGTIFVTNRSDALSTHEAIIFDNEIFNQDIYITHYEAHSSAGAGGPCNYYMELEQIDLTEDQALVAIVKNLRNEQ